MEKQFKGSNTLIEFNDPTPWKHLCKIKRYKYFTLYVHICPNGVTYPVTYRNWEIDKAEGRVAAQEVRQGKRYKGGKK